MLTYIEEFKKHLAITGFRDRRNGLVRKFIETVRREIPSDTEIQFFDARLVATWEHLYFAAFNALNAFESGRSISNTLSMEAMLFASGQTQIQKAMAILGLKPSSSNMAVLIIASKPESVELALSIVVKRIKGELDDGVLELSTKKMAIIKKKFHISETELQATTRQDDSEMALVRLLIERMALLAARK